MKPRWIGKIVSVALFLVIAIAGFGQAVHYLWNWLMPALFRLPTLTFWQAVGLLALSWMLFGGWRGFRGPGHSRGHWRHRTSAIVWTFGASGADQAMSSRPRSRSVRMSETSTIAQVIRTYATIVL